MSKFRVAIAGGGIAGLCLAAALINQGNIQVDVYEASKEFDEVGAGLTLWGRVCEALHLMGLSEECIQASVIVASTSGLPASTGFRLRDLRQPDKDFGCLPFKDAWSLHRADLLKILVRRVPTRNIYLGKRLSKYYQDDTTRPMILEFADGTRTTCDVLIGSDGIRSVVRAQMMRQEAEASGGKDYLRYIEPRWTGTIAYRVLLSSARLAARNSNHPVLSGPQVYFGKSQHVVGYPISPETLNLAVNVTNMANEGAPWPSPTWSRNLDRQTFSRDIAPCFADWHPDVTDLIETVETAIEWPIMDLEPLPFYAKGRVALIGDSAHAVVPYIGAGAAFAIEDAFVLSRILCADATTRETLSLALEAFQGIRRPYGIKLVGDTRLALREFQFNGPNGDDMRRVTASICRVCDESARVGGSGPEADADRAVSWLTKRVSATY